MHPNDLQASQFLDSSTASTASIETSRSEGGARPAAALERVCSRLIRHQVAVLRLRDVLRAKMDAATSVCVRLRPPSATENGQAHCVQCASQQQIEYRTPDGSSSTYTFDRIYGEDTTQEQVFAACEHVVQSALKGYNGTILAYGQTGSGKTHTLIGDVNKPELHGIVPRAVMALGRGIAQDGSGSEYQVFLTVVEIYCERIRDLLDPSRDNLPVKQDAHGAMFVDGATEVCVGDESQLVAVMQLGLAQRTVAATCMNAESSRSHCIVTVKVTRSCPDGTVLQGKLCMVDLAGSERQDKTQAAGQTLLEGSQINKSLSTLANVIFALSEASAEGTASGAGATPRHVPYRDSKLTRLLQDSLGGSARTVLIINASPCMDNGPETLSSLRFGSRALGVKCRVAVNSRLSPEQLQAQLQAARAQIQKLQAQLQAAGLIPSTPESGSAATQLDTTCQPTPPTDRPADSSPCTTASCGDGSKAVNSGRWSLLVLDVCYVLLLLSSVLLYMRWEDARNSMSAVA